MLSLLSTFTLLTIDRTVNWNRCLSQTYTDTPAIPSPQHVVTVDVEVELDNWQYILYNIRKTLPWLTDVTVWPPPISTLIPAGWYWYPFWLLGAAVVDLKEAKRVRSSTSSPTSAKLKLENELLLVDIKSFGGGLCYYWLLTLCINFQLSEDWWLGWLWFDLL